MRGRFIVLEGLDGVGKSTLARDLAVRLGGWATNTPGPELRAVLDTVLPALADHPAAAPLFYGASVFAAGARARRAANAGETVVIDRYWLSTLSYAGARGVELPLQEVADAVPAPDATVLLLLDEEERVRRMAARGLTTADRETLVPAFRHRVLTEMRSRSVPAALRPRCEVDLTGANREEAVERVLAGLGLAGPPQTR